MTYWRLILAYDGTPFHGWQIQPGLPTVQGVLADTIHRVLDERVLPQGSGRTDAGVHALGQVASFSLEAPIPPGRFHHALNRCLPPAIRVLSAEVVPPSFHARHSAARKTYEYRIFPLRAGAPESEAWESNICPPTLAPFVWPCPWPLDLAALNQASRHILGSHDFTTFAASDPDLTARQPGSAQFIAHGSQLVPGDSGIDDGAQRTAVRTITHSGWHASDSLLLYRVTGSGFLHHMVRNLVGTFVQAGAHRLNPDSIPSMLAARNRSAGGPTAPATGLFLVNVEYPTSSLEPRPSNEVTS